jgi:PTH1 family peptidyl-tRNA hydrolase
MEEIDDTFMVVVDDVNLPLGRMRLRRRGSDGGHNGLRSVIEEMSMDDFPRLRIGIGRHDTDLADYVLSRFSRSEKKYLDRILDRAIAGLVILFNEGFEKAQNFINSSDLGDNE